MIRIDGYYLYTLGHQIHGIDSIKVFPENGDALHTCQQCTHFLFPALFALEEFMNRSVYRLRSLDNAANELKIQLNNAIKHCTRENAQNEHPTTDVIFHLQEALREFEAILKAELAHENMYLVQQKAAFDTQTLINFGFLAFPHDLVDKANEAVEDLNSAMRCIAFELPTAAAFHLYRAIEIVLGIYWDAASGGQPRPKNQSIGAYIGEFDKAKLGNAKIISSLKDLKNIHRNPTIHADVSLASGEDAINLQGAVRAAIGYLLDEIPATDPRVGA